MVRVTDPLGPGGISAALQDVLKLQREQERLGINPGSALAQALDAQAQQSRVVVGATIAEQYRSPMREALDAIGNRTLGRAFEDHRKAMGVVGIADEMKRARESATGVDAVGTALEDHRKAMSAVGIVDGMKRSFEDAAGIGPLAHVIEEHRRALSAGGIAKEVEQAIANEARAARAVAALDVSGGIRDAVIGVPRAHGGGDFTTAERTRGRDANAANASDASVAASKPAQPDKAGDSIGTVADVGRRVREARRAMGMTQQRFADLAGVGRRFLIELEHGKESLEMGKVLAVCRAAGLRLGFFV